MAQQDTNSPEKGRVFRIIIKLGVLMCLLSIVFALFAMVPGALLTEGEDDVPEIFAWMGAGACGLFSLGTLLALGGWLLSVAMD